MIQSSQNLKVLAEGPMCSLSFCFYSFGISAECQNTFLNVTLIVKLGFRLPYSCSYVLCCSKTTAPDLRDWTNMAEDYDNLTSSVSITLLHF